MTTQTVPTERKPAVKLTFRVERGPYFLCVAIKGEASFDWSSIAGVCGGVALKFDLPTFKPGSG
jgi:hypothetical protein